MAQDIGFFEQLTGGSVDEAGLVRASIAKDIKGGGRIASMMHGLGRQAGGGLGVIGAGLLGGFGRNKETESFGEGFTSAANRAEENLVASQIGIAPEELRARRVMRKELGKEEYTDDGTHEARLKMARRAAEISNQLGDTQGLARALTMVDKLTKEKAEFDKLNAGTAATEQQTQDDSIQNGWIDGKPVTGVEDIQNGKAGMHLTGENGELYFRPYDATFNQVDPNRRSAGGGAGDTRSIAQQLKQNKGVAIMSRIHGLASSSNTALSKTDRILSNLSDLYTKGNVDAVIGTSGTVISTIDNLVRNVSGVLSEFSSKGMATDSSVNLTNRPGDHRSFAGVKGLREFAADANHAFSQLIELPPGIKATSAAAQQHRANVMEMAYMAARLAEPSNRGLSDNDVKNALIRIAGNTSNPQIMMRRFIEMQTDAAHELDYELRLLHGSLGPDVSDQQINMAAVGKGYGEYKARKDAMFEKFGITIDQAGRAVFAEGRTIGVDSAPGTGTSDTGEPADDVALLDSIFGPEGEE